MNTQYSFDLNTLIIQLTNNQFTVKEEEYLYFTYRDTNTGIETTHKISLKTDGNAICDNQKKSTWLHLAAEAGIEFMLKGFITQGGQTLNLEARDAKDLTPLMVALQASKEKSIELLLDAGADIHAKSEECYSALHLAVKTNIRVMQLIFQKREGSLNLELKTPFNDTPLYFAISGKQTEIAEMLIVEKGVNIHGSGEPGVRSPLSAAAFTCNNKILKLLLARGAEISECPLVTCYWDKSKREMEPRFLKASPIFGAVINEADEELVRTLIKFGDDPCRILSDNSNILYWSANHPDPKILELFLKLKINPNQRSYHDGDTPLLKAKKLSHITLLLEYGANPNILDKAGEETPLHGPCYGHNLDDADKIEILLNHGADPNVGRGWTPFFTFAAFHTKSNLAPRAFELTKLFLSKGAKINEEIKKKFDSSFVVKDNPEFKKLIDDHYGSCSLM